MYLSFIPVLVVLSVELIVFEKANANYVLEIAFNSWENPLKNDYVRHCCDQTTLFPPNCPEACETRFEICLRPFNSSSNENCPYGRYVIPFDSSISDPDNFTFTLGGELEGGTPNPMTYTVPTVLSDSINLIVDIYDFNAEPNNDDDLINTLTFTFNSSTPVSSQFLPILQSSVHQVGVTLNTSYRITCFTGYCGTDCEKLCNEAGVLSDSEYDAFIAIPIIVCLCFLLGVSSILVVLFRKRLKTILLGIRSKINKKKESQTDQEVDDTTQLDSQPTETKTNTLMNSNPAYGICIINKPVVAQDDANAPRRVYVNVDIP